MIQRRVRCVPVLLQGSLRYHLLFPIDGILRKTPNVLVLVQVEVVSQGVHIRILIGVENHRTRLLRFVSILILTGRALILVVIFNCEILWFSPWIFLQLLRKKFFCFFIVSIETLGGAETCIRYPVHDEESLQTFRVAAFFS